MDKNNTSKRRKISNSNEILLEYSYSDCDTEENFYISDDDNDDKALVKIINNIKDLNIDTNKELFTKLIKKIDNLEKKVETLFMVNIKIDTLKKDIDKILIEKDYVIENLRYELNDLKDELKETKLKKNLDDYFYS